MTKQNKNRKGQTTLEEMEKSGSQLIMMHDDGMEQPIEEILQDDPTTNDINYENWWNQFRGHWLQSEKMTEDEIKTRADEAWEFGNFSLYFFMPPETTHVHILSKRL